jgi:hypothetical protein
MLLYVIFGILAFLLIFSTIDARSVIEQHDQRIYRSVSDPNDDNEEHTDSDQEEDEEEDHSQSQSGEEQEEDLYDDETNDENYEGNFEMNKVIIKNLLYDLQKNNVKKRGQLKEYLRQFDPSYSEKEQRKRARINKALRMMGWMALDPWLENDHDWLDADLYLTNDDISSALYHLETPYNREWCNVLASDFKDVQIKVLKELKE